jgi:tight adherence protein C
MDIVVSVGFFVSIVVFIMALFSGEHKVQISPQREAAIATGHEDRKTLFENAVLRPILWILLSISTKLNMPKFKGYIQHHLIASGNPDYYTPEEYIAVSMFFGLVLAGFFETFYYLLQGTFGFMVIFLGILMGMGLHLVQLVSDATKRLRHITRQLPYSLELISLGMGAGATFTEAVKTVIREEGEDNPLNEEFRALLSEIDLGTTRRQALQNVAARVPLDSVRTIVASVRQAEELGTPLANVLHDQATLLRMQRSVRAENLAASASIKILIPCLLLVVAVILTVFGPWIVRIVQVGMF